MQYMGIDRAHSRKPRQQLQQFKIIQVIPVAHDIALDLAAIHPGDMVLHIARHQIRRVRDNLWATAHMTLLDIRHSLSSQHPPLSLFFLQSKGKKKKGGKTYSLDRLHHPRPHHHNSQPPPTKRRNCHLALHP